MKRKPRQILLPLPDTDRNDWSWAIWPVIGFLLVLIGLTLLLSGCTSIDSSTQDAQGVTTHLRAWTFFDSSAALQKFSNRGSTTASNEWSSGTTIGQLNQQASGTNFNDLLGTVVGAAVKAAVKP